MTDKKAETERGTSETSKRQRRQWKRPVVTRIAVSETRAGVSGVAGDVFETS